MVFLPTSCESLFLRAIAQSSQEMEPPANPGRFTLRVSRSVLIEIDLANRLALRPREVAQALGISERKLRELSPRLPVVRADGVLLYPVEGVREWLRAEAINQAAQANAVADQILKDL